MRARDGKQPSPMLLRMNVFSLRRVLADRSHSHEVTGRVQEYFEKLEDVWLDQRITLFDCLNKVGLCSDYLFCHFNVQYFSSWSISSGEGKCIGKVGLLQKCPLSHLSCTV